jgi:aminoglycoside phosphotransferase
MNAAIAFLQQNRARLRLDAQQVPERLSAIALTPRFQASRHVVFMVLAEATGRPVLVVKIPRLADASDTLEREAANLRALESLRPGGFPSVPRVVAFERHAGWPLLVQTALEGSLMSPAVVRRNHGSCCRVVAEWLADLHDASAATGGPAWLDELVETPLDHFARAFPLSADERTLIERTRAIVEPLAVLGLPFVHEHGDLGHPNLLLEAEHLGVIDWELANPRGLVLYDLFFFLLYAGFSRHRAQSTGAHVKAFDRTFLDRDAWALPYVRSLAERLRVPSEALYPLFVLCWARYTVTLLRRLVPANAEPEAAAGVADWLRRNRYYRLWRHAVEQAAQRPWS